MTTAVIPMRIPSTVSAARVLLRETAPSASRSAWRSVESTSSPRVEQREQQVAEQDERGEEDERGPDGHGGAAPRDALGERGDERAALHRGERLGREERDGHDEGGSDDAGDDRVPEGEAHTLVARQRVAEALAPRARAEPRPAEQAERLGRDEQ